MSIRRSKILIIDDTPSNLFTLGKALASDYDLQIATSGPMGLTLASELLPNLILLDVTMPEMDGFETCIQLKANPVLKDIPVIFVTGLSDPDFESKGLALGAVDYITKPFNVEITRMRIKNLFERENLRLQVQIQRDFLIASINENTQVKVAFQKGMDLLQKIVCQVPGVVYQLLMRPDGSYCIPFVSEAIQAIFRLTQQEVYEDSSKIFSLIHPNDYDGVVASIQQSARDLTPWRYEYRVKFDDGAVRWLLSDALPQRDENGVVLWHGFIMDVTERKKTETNLVESEALLRAIFENEPQCIKVVDVNGRLRLINPAGLAMIEADTFEQVALLNMIDVVAPEYRPAYAEMHKRILAGESMQLTYEVLGLKRGRRWLETHAVPMVVNGKTEQLAVTRDITKHKQAEDALRISYEALQSILETTLDGVLRIDQQGNLLDVNQTYCEQSKFTKEKLLGMHITDLDIYQNPSEVSNYIQIVLDRGRNQFESKHRRKDGSIWQVEVSCTYRKTACGQIFAFVRDISERKQSEATLRIAAAAFEAQEGLVVTDVNKVILHVNRAFRS